MNESNRRKMKELASFYSERLLEVMRFWEVRTEDKECGGYLTCFDRTGNVTDTDKYIWFQGRQLWMFPALYNQVEKRQLWLDLAQVGRDFIVEKAYAGSGRWRYQLDRQGNEKQGTISIYTDHFVLEGLCEYAAATDSEEDMPLIVATYDAIERNMQDPEFKDLFHDVWDARYKQLGAHMITMDVASVVSKVLGAKRTKPLIDYCLEQILYVFAQDEYEAVFECIGRDGRVLTDESKTRTLNPGHSMESVWFSIEAAKAQGNTAAVERAITIAEWMYSRGYDKEHGGLFSFLDCSGEEPVLTAWHKETNVQWHDKVWWAHSEALFALALVAVETESDTWFERFVDLHDWCWKCFHDAEYGEWYPELYRDGTVKLADKGTLWKAAYHLPRALMKVMQVFEEYEDGRRKR